MGQKIGNAEEVFENLEGEPMYIKVRMGLLIPKTMLIPIQFVEADEYRRTFVLK